MKNCLTLFALAVLLFSCAYSAKNSPSTGKQSAHKNVRTTLMIVAEKSQAEATADASTRFAYFIDGEKMYGHPSGANVNHPLSLTPGKHELKCVSSFLETEEGTSLASRQRHTYVFYLEKGKTGSFIKKKTSCNGEFSNVRYSFKK